MSEIFISVENAKPEKLFLVVSNFAVVDSARRAVLLIKRGDHEKVHPGKWAFPGGKLEHSNVAEMIKEEGVDPLVGVEGILGKLATRETQEEAGLTVDKNDGRVIKDKLFVRPDGVPVFMTTMAVRYAGGEIALEEGITEYAWATAPELADYDCIEGIVEEAHLALEVIK